jgi:hypothetical protein
MQFVFIARRTGSLVRGVFSNIVIQLSSVMSIGYTRMRHCEKSPIKLIYNHSFTRL